MRLMHTKLPEFIEKMKTAAVKHHKDRTITIKGLENLKSVKMQSLRTGRIEEAVEEIANMDEVKDVELIVIPRVPETMHTAIVKGIGEDGKTKKIILEVINIIHATEEVEFDDCTDIVDRRPKIGLH